MTGAAQWARGGMSIGSVLDLLRPDFPDITISKIRFLEAEGLIRPERTPSGYRRFSVADCERLRFVLTAQRDQYLPLKVIKEQLEAIDSGAATLGVREARARGPTGRPQPQPPPPPRGARPALPTPPGAGPRELIRRTATGDGAAATPPARCCAAAGSDPRGNSPARVPVPHSARRRAAATVRPDW